MGHAEVKIFKNEDGRLAWHVGVTSECLDKEDPTQLKENVPVVFRYYDQNHAYAAKVVKTIVNGSTTSYNECHAAIDHDQWEGMRLGELKSLTDRIELSMGVTFFAVKSVEQTLSREKWLAPGYVTQPQEAADVGGELAVGKRGFRTLRQPRLTASAISMMLIAVAGLSALSIGSDCFEMDSKSEQLYFADGAEAAWADDYGDSSDLIGGSSSERQIDVPEKDSLAHSQVCEVWGTEMWTEAEHGVCLDELYDSHFRDKQPAVQLQEDVHFKLLQEDVKRKETTADMMRAVGSMDPERKRWRGLLESLYWNAAFDAAMRVFRLLRQIVPVMREWQHFNEFDFQDMPDFDSKQVGVTPARGKCHVVWVDAG